ncbi:josephin-1 isoform X1 [Sitophilus oryzae]|uniref:Josephin-2 n=1 Tax=Sitophilus oryzae TaxID=7048 RepID=A0A6J2XHH5_SITOR|nr:josephin-1 isoform X1 [Sitophilus oryzae]
MISDQSYNESIYHEKQIRELCALHALNNLFQDKNAFSKNELDQICHTLSPEYWINPHKSVIGLGNYDVNVIMSALQSRGYDMIWFDKRKDPACIDLKNIVGFILNTPSEYKIGFITFPLKRRHWIALREINGIYYNLDSKLDIPKIIGTSQDLNNFICNELDSQDKELFIVTTAEAGVNQCWLKENSNYNNKICDSQTRDAEEILIADIKN